jgi:hypothetical protein
MSHFSMQTRSLLPLSASFIFFAIPVILPALQIPAVSQDPPADSLPLRHPAKTRRCAQDTHKPNSQILELAGQSYPVFCRSPRIPGKVSRPFLVAPGVHQKRDNFTDSNN